MGVFFLEVVCSVNSHLHQNYFCQGKIQPRRKKYPSWRAYVLLWPYCKSFDDVDELVFSINFFAGNRKLRGAHAVNKVQDISVCCAYASALFRVFFFKEIATGLPKLQYYTHQSQYWTLLLYYQKYPDIYLPWVRQQGRYQGKENLIWNDLLN